jgi:hypothetical protein
LYTLGRGLQWENRRKRRKKLGREDKVETAEGKRLMEWIEENGKQRGNNDRLRNSERRSVGKSRRIQNMRE